MLGPPNLGSAHPLFETVGRQIHSQVRSGLFRLRGFAPWRLIASRLSPRSYDGEWVGKIIIDAAIEALKTWLDLSRNMPMEHPPEPRENISQFEKLLATLAAGCVDFAVAGDNAVIINRYLRRFGV